MAAPRTVSVSIGLSRDEHRSLAAAAEKEMISKTAFARRAVFLAAELALKKNNIETHKLDV